MELYAGHHRANDEEKSLKRRLNESRAGSYNE